MAPQPPMRNLSPMAEPWGRWAQEEILDIRRAAESLGATTQNDGRSSNATMDNISGQVSELFAQQSESVAFPKLSITPPQSAWASNSVSVAAPDPDGGSRYATITFSGVPSITNPNLQAVAFFQLSVDGQTIARSSIPAVGASVPPDYLPTLQVTGAFVLNPGATITLLVWASKFTADPGNIVVSGLQAVISPAQLVMG